MYSQYYNNMLGFGFMGVLMMIIFWIFVIILIVWLVKESRLRDKSGLGDSEKSLNILKERYAKSEISKKEFEEKKKDLTN